jgi:DNA-binding LacI/PurR family transcriptional regulator
MAGGAVSTEARRPLFRALADELRLRVQASEPDTRLPTEAELCRVHGVSLVTVRKALDILTAEGLIVRIPGRGTFVRSASPVGVLPAAGATVALSVAIKPNWPRGFLSQEIMGVTRFFERQGVSVVLKEEPADPAEADAFLGGLIQARIPGLIYHCSSRDFVYALARSPLAARIPMVFLNARIDDVECDYVTCNNFLGATLAADYLLDLGHRRLAFLYPYRGAQSHDISVHDRWDGFERRVKAAGGEAVCFSSWQDDPTPPEERLLARTSEFTAAFCGNDLVAAQFMRALTSRGVRVPGEVSIVGFDNNLDVCEHAISPITTVAQPALEMGARAAQLLWERLTGRCVSGSRRVQLDPTLVARESVAVPRGACPSA